MQAHTDQERFLMRKFRGRLSDEQIKHLAGLIAKSLKTPEAWVSFMSQFEASSRKIQKH